MKMNRQLAVALVAVTGALCWQSQLLGAEQQQQSAEGQRQPQWRQRLQDWRAQGQGNFDTNEIRARIGDRLKTMLRSTDEEWKVIQPLVEDVVAKQGVVMREQIGGMLGAWGMMSGRRDSPNARAEDPQSPQRRSGSAETLALRQVLESDNAPVSEIKAKLKELREARKAAETALRDAREKLRSVLGHRQEAQLVLLGILD
jgi:Spy/CpxP family protein refolding chaperone